MTGYLLYTAADAKRNEFLIERYIQAARQAGVTLCVVITDAADACAALCGINSQSFVINRTRDFALAKKLFNAGAYVSNSPRVCETANDKLKTYVALKNIVPMLPTIAADSPIESADGIQYPCVVKPVSGHGGQGVALIHDENELDEYFIAQSGAARDTLGLECGFDLLLMRSRYIIQPLAKETGRDLRVYVIGGKPVAAMQRESSIDFRSNYSLGGNAYFRSVDELTRGERAIVNAVSGELNPDYIGVDIIYDVQNGVRTPILNEIEDPVGARMLYNNTDIDPAQLHLQCVLNNLRKGNRR